MFPSITDFIEDWQQEESRITETRRKPDRTGHFYHVVTQSWTKEMIFYRDVAVYRDTLLGKLCTEKGIRILFSVCMPNHTQFRVMNTSWVWFGMHTENRILIPFSVQSLPSRVSL